MKNSYHQERWRGEAKGARRRPPLENWLNMLFFHGFALIFAVSPPPPPKNVLRPSSLPIASIENALLLHNCCIAVPVISATMLFFNVDLSNCHLRIRNFDLYASQFDI